MYNKQEKEDEVCKFFIRQYKKKISIKPDTKDEESDYILMFPEKEIKIQMISCDHEAIAMQVASKKIHRNNKKNNKDNDNIVAINRVRTQDILQAIKKKSSHYEPNLLKEMFLVIHSENISMDAESLRKEKTIRIACKNSSYKAIFFIKLPDNKNKKTYPQNKGDTIQLK